MTAGDWPGARRRRRRVGWASVAAGCRDYLCGRVSREAALGLLGPAAILCFVAAVALGLFFFPTPYDFRHRWVSSLASARHNPDGYVYFGAGLTVVAVLLLPIPGYLYRRCQTLPITRAAGSLLLWVGTAGLFSLGVQSTFFPDLARSRDAHHLFTVVTFIGLTLGFVSFGLLSAWPAGPARSNRWWAWLGCAVVAAPSVGAGLTHLILEFGPDVLGWGSLREARHAAPFFLQLTFWEWAAVLSLFAGGYLTVWAAPPPGPPPRVDPATAWSPAQGRGDLDLGARP